MFFQFLEVLIVLFGKCYGLNNFQGFFLTINWNKVADEGKQDCQINSLVQLLSKNRIMIIEKIDKLKFNDKFNCSKYWTIFLVSSLKLPAMTIERTSFSESKFLSGNVFSIKYLF
ncbi:hypothetical protein ES708_18887 [subsurface metagenome]